MRPPLFFGKCTRCFLLDCGRGAFNALGDKGCYGCQCDTGIRKLTSRRLDEFCS